MKPLLILLTCAALALCSCSKREMDTHAMPREAKAYESIDAATLSKADLIAHLETILSEINAAANAGTSTEFHHLEAALTPTLDALEALASKQGNQAALKEIAMLKPIAIKLHQAGHDNNAKMGTKLAAAISKQGKTLINTLQ